MLSWYFFFFLQISTEHKVQRGEWNAISFAGILVINSELIKVLPESPGITKVIGFILMPTWYQIQYIYNRFHGPPNNLWKILLKTTNVSLMVVVRLNAGHQVSSSGDCEWFNKILSQFTLRDFQSGPKQWLNNRAATLSNIHVVSQFL